MSPKCITAAGNLSGTDLSPGGYVLFFSFFDTVGELLDVICGMSENASDFPLLGFRVPAICAQRELRYISSVGASRPL